MLGPSARTTSWSWVFEGRKARAEPAASARFPFLSLFDSSGSLLLLFAVPSRILLSLLTLLVTAAFLPATPLAITPGEKFVYRLAWGPFRKAASLEIVAEQDPDSKEPMTRITTHTATRGMIRALYAFDGWGQFFYEPDSGRLLRATAWTETSRKKTNATMTIDYETMKADYVDHVRPARSLELDIPEAQAFDFLTTLIQSRNWDVEIGKDFAVPVYFDDELYDLVISVEERSKVSTPQGKRDALLLVPRMPVEPKGMFEDGGEIKVWVSDDELRLPLRFEVKVPVGTAMAVLTEHITDFSGEVVQAKPSTPSPHE